MNVVITLGTNGDPAALGPQPANVQVHRFVPQAQVLPLCDAVDLPRRQRHDARRLAHGLPQLVLPQGADQFANAELLAATGAGRTLLPHETQPAQIRRGVVELLENAELRAAAGRLRDELDAMPLPDAAIERIEALCRVTRQRSARRFRSRCSRSAAFVGEADRGVVGRRPPRRRGPSRRSRSARMAWNRW